MSEDNINAPYTNINDILKKIPNRFLLTVGVSKRAKQLKDGAKPLIEYDPEQPLDFVAIALKEINQGLVKVELEETQSDKDAELFDSLEDYLDVDVKLEEKDIDAKNEDASDDKKNKDKKNKPKSKSLAA
tara:strand:+ start:203 stop:592 length:390 start_codon:yes stop_codon:yes gene_type:complete